MTSRTALITGASGATGSAAAGSAGAGSAGTGSTSGTRDGGGRAAFELKGGQGRAGVGGRISTTSCHARFYPGPPFAGGAPSAAG